MTVQSMLIVGACCVKASSRVFGVTVQSMLIVGACCAKANSRVSGVTVIFVITNSPVGTIIVFDKPTLGAAENTFTFAILNSSI